MSKEDIIHSRDSIEEKYKWDLSPFYPNIQAWENDFQKLKGLLPLVQPYIGTLKNSSQTLSDFFKLKEDMIILTSRLYTYAKMRWDENTKVNQYKGLFDRAQHLSNETEQVLSFVEPELLENIEVVSNYVNDEPKLQQYKRYFDRLRAQKQHILSDKEEKIISEASALSQGPENIFNVLSDSDLKFPLIKDENNEDKQLSHGRFIRFMENYNQTVRKNAFNGMYGTYREFANTYATILNAHIKSDIFYSRVRNYNNALEAALKPNEIPVEVYHNLIDSVTQSLPILQKYLQLRKEQLRLDTLAMYDLYVPIVPDVNFTVTYEEACDMILNSLAPLGEEYVNTVRNAFQDRWIDVFENEGKRSGAYSWGSYQTYPYILMNFQNNLNSVFTLAHEIGHSMHTYYSKKSQPFATSDYVIFVAEVASTVNETLLFNYLLETSTDPMFKAYLINYHIEGFRTTVFRQTMFAEFEKTIHEVIESGDSLTSDQLCEMYYLLNVKYYTPAVEVDKDIELEWARIPHFYYNYYVYQYATGFSAAQALTKHIMENGKEAVEKYIAFLSGGSSKTPIELLKDAGVDMTSPQPILEAFSTCDRYIDELAKCLKD